MSTRCLELEFFHLGTNTSLRVPERGSAVLPLLFLSATDVDTDDEMLIFEVLNPPRLGALVINDEVSPGDTVSASRNCFSNQLETFQEKIKPKLFQ